jgi:hypothetical protein
MNSPANEILKPGKLSLHVLVSRVLENQVPEAANNRNFVVNDVPAELPVSVDEHALFKVLSAMLHVVVSQARESCIRVMAKSYGNIILLHIRDSNAVNSYAVESGLARFKHLAESMGGYLDVTSQRKKVLTIAFSFPNVSNAA